MGWQDNRHFSEYMRDNGLVRMREITEADALTVIAQNDSASLKEMLIHMADDHYKLRVKRVVSEAIRAIWKLNIHFMMFAVPLHTVRALGRKLMQQGKSGFKAGLHLLVKYEKHVYNETSLGQEAFQLLGLTLKNTDSTGKRSVFQICYDMLTDVHCCGEYENVGLCQLFHQTGLLQDVILEGMQLSFLKNPLCDIISMVAEHESLVDFLLTARVHVTLSEMSKYPHTSNKALEALSVMVYNIRSAVAEEVWDEIGHNTMEVLSQAGVTPSEVLSVCQITLSLMRVGGQELVRKILQADLMFALLWRASLFVEEMDSGIDSERSQEHYYFFQNLKKMSQISEVVNDEIKRNFIQPLLEIASQAPLAESMECLEILLGAAYCVSAIMPEFPSVAMSLLRKGVKCQMQLAMHICHRILEESYDDDSIREAFSSAGLPAFISSLKIGESKPDLEMQKLCQRIMSLFSGLN